MDGPRARRLVEAIRRAFDDAEVTGYGHLVDGLAVSPSDRHVAAAAIVAGAPIIVTIYLRDFPRAALAPFGVEVRSPDQFLQQLFAPAPRAMLQIIEDQAADLTSPPLTVPDIIDELSIFAPAVALLIRRFRTQHTVGQ